ncbi:D-alanine aminotransferase [Arenibacter antarcticus]|uniref:Aminotransferase class IV n=1 Tax=Arenibacter antarcticus TaxID=2040469 RepID=A0ABW5VF16_9FLAO|nr:aminotransferase class IV [Arenibacter sp. H213]MCM4166351.1 aminotransferase IV [Arenibacter sp. H213]
MKNSYPKKVYLNGDILEPESAKISVFDRGFLFGDGIYEVMAQINGHFFYEKAHIKRLEDGLRKINIEFSTSLLRTEIPKILKASDLVDKDCLLYIQVTRGVAPRQHAYPKDIQPTFMMYATPKILPEINSIKATVVTSEDFRWSRCDIKMISLLGNVMANEYAIQKKCFENVLIRNGVVTEASHCNVFFVKNSVVYTHPADTYILDGITRQIVLELCVKLGIEVREVGVTEEDMLEMDEAFLTGTSTQIASIQQWDDYFFYHDNEVGEITQKLQLAFRNLKYNLG